MTIEVRKIQVDEASIEESSLLLRTVWPSDPKFLPSYLKWLYRDNPVGHVVGFNAYEGTTLAAHYATVPLEASVEGKAMKGLLSLNTATHPSHQGKGLFTRLANQTYEEAHAAGFAFVIGVANASSTPGFVRKLGFQLVCPLDVRVGIGPLGAETRDATAWQRTWSPQSIAWRIAAPSARYVYRRESRGVVVEAKTQWPLIRAVLGYFEERELVEKLTELPEGRLGPRVWMGTGREKWPLGYAPLPDRLKPSPLHLIFKRLDQKVGSVAAGNIQFQALDFDAY